MECGKIRVASTRKPHLNLIAVLGFLIVRDRRVNGFKVDSNKNCA